MIALKKLIATIAFIATLIVCIVLLGGVSGCKQIRFERIEREPHLAGTNVVAVTEKIVRGEYESYGLQNNLEGLEVVANPSEGVKVRIERANSDMSDKHEKIIEASGKTVGTVVGAAAAAAVK